jgi:hypothetical protein
MTGYCACDCTAFVFEGDTCETETSCADGHTCSNGGAITGTTVVAGDCACDCTGTGYEDATCSSEVVDAKGSASKTTAVAAALAAAAVSALMLQ